MSKRLMSVLLGGVVGAIFSVSAHAMPLSPLAGQQGQLEVTPVAGGCGPGFHRTPYGNCVPNYYYGGPRPYYPPPPPRACPYGYRLDPWGRCVPW
jgi:hypothetical protein